MRTELSVGAPRPVVRRFERQQIDEDRTAAAELDVVGGRILQHHIMFERGLLNLKRQKRGVLQLPERPLVRIGDEFDLLRLQRFERTGFDKLIGLPERNQQPVAAEPLPEA